MVTVVVKKSVLEELKKNRPMIWLYRTEEIFHRDGYDQATDIIKNAQTVTLHDTQFLVGQWKTKDGKHYCSICHENGVKTRFCGHCGALMMFGGEYDE